MQGKKHTTKSKSKGLGDTIEKAIKATGLDKLAPDHCGCEERKKKLNALFPYTKNLNMTEHQKSVYLRLAEEIRPNGTATRDSINSMTILYNEVFSDKKKLSSCGSCILGMMNKLKTVYENSCES